ncbi:MAG: phosphotransferase [Magnetococcales bacterium]|nr:phosphotransferase [Magnetococcales bacterium]
MCLVDKKIQDLLALATELLAEPVQLVKITGGGNHGLLHLTAKTGEYALKYDPLPAGDGRDRIANEWQAIAFMWQQGVRVVPQPVAWRQEERCALYGWVRGEPIREVDAGVVAAMGAFLQQLTALQDDPVAQTLPLASDAFVSPAHAAQQVERRRQRLLQEGEGLESFLLQEFTPIMEKVVEAAQQALGETWCQPSPLMLSPSDFGIHNMMRRIDGEIVFLDMDYFGWDDPAKLTSDVLWHPAMHLSPAMQQHWLTMVRGWVADLSGWSQRWQVLHPLNGLIWCLILLNPFTPTGWHRLAYGGNRQELLAKRLEQARLRLQTLTKAQP